MLLSTQLNALYATYFQGDAASSRGLVRGGPAPRGGPPSGGVCAKGRPSVRGMGLCRRPAGLRRGPPYAANRPPQIRGPRVAWCPQPERAIVPVLHIVVT